MTKKSPLMLLMLAFLLSSCSKESPELVPCMCNGEEATLGMFDCMCEPMKKKPVKRISYIQDEKPTQQTMMLDREQRDAYLYLHQRRDVFAPVKLEYVDFRIQKGRKYDEFDTKLGNYRFRIFGCRRESKNVFLNQGRAMQKDMRFFDVFFESMNDYYPVVVDKTSPYFLESDRIEVPEYLMTAEINDYFMNICDEFDWNEVKQKRIRSGSSEITVTWRLMDLTRENVYCKGTTTGYGQISEGEPNGETLLVERAFEDALNKVPEIDCYNRTLAKRVSPKEMTKQIAKLQEMQRREQSFATQYENELKGISLLQSCATGLPVTDASGASITTANIDGSSGISGTGSNINSQSGITGSGSSSGSTNETVLLPDGSIAENSGVSGTGSSIDGNSGIDGKGNKQETIILTDTGIDESFGSSAKGSIYKEKSATNNEELIVIEDALSITTTDVNKGEIPPIIPQRCANGEKSDEYGYSCSQYSKLCANGEKLDEYGYSCSQKDCLNGKANDAEGYPCPKASKPCAKGEKLDEYGYSCSESSRRCAKGKKIDNEGYSCSQKDCLTGKTSDENGHPCPQASKRCAKGEKSDEEGYSCSRSSKLCIKGELIDENGYSCPEIYERSGSSGSGFSSQGGTNASGKNIQHQKGETTGLVIDKKCRAIEINDETCTTVKTVDKNVTIADDFWVDVPLDTTSNKAIENRRQADNNFSSASNRFCIQNQTPYETLNPSNLYKVRASVVSVENSTGKKGAGLIIADNLILTSADLIVKGNNNFNIQTINGGTFKAGAFRINPSKNVALLLLEERTQYSPLPLSLALPEVNKDIFMTLGIFDFDKEGEGYLDNGGKVIGYRYTQERGAEIIVDTFVQTVSLGGALIDKNGNVVGLAHDTKKLDDTPDLFIPIETALKGLGLEICGREFTTKQKPAAFKTYDTPLANAIDASQDNKSPTLMKGKERK